jgi:inosose dehydratase
VTIPSAAATAARPATGLPGRLAGAPISWGVCEVPGWGAQLDADRVLGEMHALGLRATELGPVGYLGTDAGSVRALLGRHELTLVGGFLPLVLHDRARLDETLALARETSELYESCGAQVLVTTAVLDEGWSRPRPLTDDEWRRLANGLARVDGVAEGHGLTHAFHPHAGTLVETADQVQRLLEESTVRLCLDTGHLTIGGADPLALVSELGERIGHVHLKDVDMEVARRLRAGEVSLLEAVRLGLFRPLGAGDVPIDDVVSALRRAGYDGWLVLEQDVALETARSPGAGPIDDVRSSIMFLQGLFEGEAMPEREGER